MDKELIYEVIHTDIPCVLYLPKKGNRPDEITAAYYSLEGGIEMMVDNTIKTPRKIWCLLHEIGHYIHFEQYGGPKLINKRHNYHPVSYWDIVIPLYKRYDVIDIALEYEYVRGIKLIKKSIFFK